MEVDAVLSYIVSKLLPLALLPLGLSLVLLVVGLVGRWRWPLVTAASLLWVFSLGLVSQSLWRWLEAPWQRRMATAAPRADAIVVLSGGRHPAPGPARVSEWVDPDRFLAGIDLYREGKAPRLLFTGGASPFLPAQPAEGQRYLQEARRLGIPADAKASTPPVVNTAEEAVAIRRLLGPKSSTPNAHRPDPAGHQYLSYAPRPACLSGRVSRCCCFRWTFRRAAAGPAPGGPMVAIGAGPDDSSRALRELIGRLVYRCW